MKKISKQKKWQMKKAEQGLCVTCGKRPIVENRKKCEYCLESDRLRKMHGDKHVLCYSYPNCDLDPMGCRYQTDEPEQYGHRG